MKKKLKFKLSLKYLNLTSKYNCRSWKERFDILYLGSDQIWNTKITKGVDPVFYGEISGGCFYRIAYAASLGEDSSDNSYANEMRRKLENIQKISEDEYIVFRFIDNEKEVFGPYNSLELAKKAKYNLSFFEREYFRPIRIRRIKGTGCLKRIRGIHSKTCPLDSLDSVCPHDSFRILST